MYNSYIKYEDGHTEPIIAWLTRPEDKDDHCVVLAESGYYKWERSYRDYSTIEHPILPIVVVNSFYKLCHRQL